MSFSTAVTDLGHFVHNPGDTAVLGRCLVMALRDMRAETPEWGEGTFTFVGEADVSSYAFGSWPLIPGGVLSFASRPLVSHTAIAGAILEPDTLVSSTNLTGDITDVQDSAELPDENYLDATTAANTGFEVRWDVALSRPLLTGAGKQVMRVACYNEGTDLTINWTVKEGGVDVQVGTFTIDDTETKAYHVAWDASNLSTLNPAANQISLELEDINNGANAGEAHFGAVQWFPHGRVTTSDQAVTGGMRPLIGLQQQEIRNLVGGRVEVSIAEPTHYAVWNQRLYLYPTPNGSYWYQCDYRKDSTRDDTTGALLTESSTTETNDWLAGGPGYQELLVRALQIYYELRPHDAKAAALAGQAAFRTRASNALAAELDTFSRPPRSWF